MLAVLVVTRKAVIAASLNVKADLVEAYVAVGLVQLVGYLSNTKTHI